MTGFCKASPMGEWWKSIRKHFLTFWRFFFPGFFFFPANWCFINFKTRENFGDSDGCGRDVVVGGDIQYEADHLRCPSPKPYATSKNRKPTNPTSQHPTKPQIFNKNQIIDINSINQPSYAAMPRVKLATELCSSPLCSCQILSINSLPRKAPSFNKPSWIPAKHDMTLIAKWLKTLFSGIRDTWKHVETWDKSCLPS